MNILLLAFGLVLEFCVRSSVYMLTKSSLLTLVVVREEEFVTTCGARKKLK